MKGLHVVFLQKRSLDMIPRGVSFFATKIRISQQKLNQHRKYFNSWSVAQVDSNYEKNRGQKSRWTDFHETKF